MPNTGEWLQLFLLLFAPAQALASFLLAFLLKSADKTARVAVLVVSALVAAAPILSGLSVARQNSWFATLGYGGAALEVVGLVVLARTAFNSPLSPPAGRGSG